MERSTWRLALRRLTLLALFSGATGLIAAWFVAGQLMAPAPHTAGSPPKDLDIASFSIPSESGSTIAGWQSTAVNSRGCIVLLHGIRQSRRSMVSRARLMDELGYSTVMIDFQAHGESDGESITIGHLERLDVQAAVAFAKNAHPGEAIGVIGVSLGGAAALLASPLEVDALVLESVYSTIDEAVYNRVAQKLGALAVVPTNLLLMQLKPRLGIRASQLRPIDRIASAGCPVFILSGAEDVHTTAAETRRIFEAARSPKELWIVPGAAHVDLLAKSSEEYRARVAQFLDRNMHSASGKFSEAHPVAK